MSRAIKKQLEIMKKQCKIETIQLELTLLHDKKHTIQFATLEGASK